MRLLEAYALRAEKASVLYRHLFEPFRYWYREILRREPEVNNDPTQPELYGDDPDCQWSRGWEYPWVLLHGDFQVGHTVLDAGAGASPLPMLLARQGCQVTAVDFDVVGEGAKAKLWGCHPELTLGLYRSEWADLTRMKYDDATFDRVVSVGVLEHLKDRGLAISELMRVLKPGGLLIVTEDREVASLPGAVPPAGALVYRTTVVAGWVEQKNHV